MATTESITQAPKADGIKKLLTGRNKAITLLHCHPTKVRLIHLAGWIFALNR